MNEASDAFPAEVKQDTAVLNQESFNTSINGTEYLLESRVLLLDGVNSRPEYRVLLGQAIIKDWTEGDVGRYFGV